MPTETKYCSRCNKTTPQNSLRDGNTRCTQCGFPPRGGQKHELAQAGSPTGKYKMVAKP